MSTTMPTTHHLSSAWVFFVLRRAPKKSRKEDETAAEEDYEKAIKRVATFDTVEGFWKAYGVLMRPAEKLGGAANMIDLHLFKKGVRPVWEDPANKGGGKLVVKIKKGLGARYWESTLLAMIGDQFGGVQDTITGAVISVRHGEDVLSIWTRQSSEQDHVQLKDHLKKTVKIPPFVPLEYKPHQGGGGGGGGGGSTSAGQGMEERAPAWRNPRRHNDGGNDDNMAGGGGWR